jgi:lipopolysaccharide transport system permease protein
MISTLIKNKDLILYKSWAELRAEARRYYISYAWWILEPLFEMIVFYLVFDVLMSRGGPNFVQFLLIGLIAWKWFGTTVQRCGNSIMGAKGLILQTSLPKIVFPTVFILTDTFKAIISAGLILFLLIISGFLPNVAYFALPALLVVQLLLIMAVGYSLSALVPYVPDLGILISHLLRMLFFLSGIFWNPDIIASDNHRTLFFMNPMALLIHDYREVLLHGRWPEPMPLITVTTIAIAIIAGASHFIHIKEAIYPRIINQ